MLVRDSIKCFLEIKNYRIYLDPVVDGLVFARPSAVKINLLYFTGVPWAKTVLSFDKNNMTIINNDPLHC